MNPSNIFQKSPTPPPPSEPSVVDPAQPINLGLPQPEKQGPVNKTVALVVVTIVALAFICLFAWALISWNQDSSNIENQIAVAVANAVAENTTELEDACSTRLKSPYSTFTGPVDYGTLTFPYPRTWSVYVASDASKGGNYEAYFNPDAVQPVSSTTVNALRVYIKDQSFETTISPYESNVKNGKLTMSVIRVNDGNDTANIYYGTISTNMTGYVAIMKIRDKTAIIQTDSEIYGDEFNDIISSLKFNS